MARIKIILPDRLLYQTALSVRISDINYGGHLGHDSVLSLFHEARARFFKVLGYSEIDFEGLSILIADVAIVYKAEAFYNETLTIGLFIGHFFRVGCDMFYLIRNPKKNIEIARGKTGIVFYNHSAKKVAPVPVHFREAIDNIGNQASENLLI